MEKENNRFKKLLIRENIIIVCVLALLFVKGCFEMFEETPPPSVFNIHRCPDKLTYVIGKDEELDVSGGVICSVLYDWWGHYGRPCISSPTAEVDHGEHGYLYTMEEALLDGEITSDIDFTKEGIYTVRIKCWDGSELCFPVAVISPESAAAMH